MLDIIIGLILPLITVQVIKRVLKNVFVIFRDKGIAKLPHGVQLVLGLVISFVFAAFAQVGWSPELVKFADPIIAVILSLASKAIYDLIHEYGKK